MAEQIRKPTEAWRKHGLNVEMTDLWCGGERNDVVEYLSGHGWTTVAATVPELADAQGRSLPRPAEEQTGALPGLQYVTAKRT
jgi:O-methyltransferase involved in polyketide biosynthesis